MKQKTAQKRVVKDPFLLSAYRQVMAAASQLGLSSAQTESLLKPVAKHVFTIRLKNGDHIVDLPAFRIQHSNALGPHKGGIRFHPDVGEEEVEALALLMSIKTAAIGLPLGGGKGGVAIDPKQFNLAQLEEVARAYVAHLHPHIGPDKDVPAPDVNTDAAIIDWMADEYAKQTGDSSGAAFTGKSIQNGGSHGRDAATGRGGVYALDETLKYQNEARQLTVAVQGVGNVGYWFAKLAEADERYKIVSISDSKGTIVSRKSLDIDAVVKAKKRGGSVLSYDPPSVQAGAAEKIIGLNVDVLVLAALDDVVRAENANKIKAKYILELANGPVSEEASRMLYKKGKIVIPDVIANAGGVIVSYYEWLQNRRQEKWTEEEVNQRLELTMRQAVDEMVTRAKQRAVSYKDAAFQIALQRLIDADKNKVSTSA